MNQVLTQVLLVALLAAAGAAMGLAAGFFFTLLVMCRGGCGEVAGHGPVDVAPGLALVGVLCGLAAGCLLGVRMVRGQRSGRETF